MFEVLTNYKITRGILKGVLQPKCHLLRSLRPSRYLLPHTLYSGVTTTPGQSQHHCVCPTYLLPYMHRWG